MPRTQSKAGGRFDAAHAEASRHFGLETEETMFYDAAKRDHGLSQDPLKSLIVPRPIGWISTFDRAGRVNLAPYSFYNGVSEYPPPWFISPSPAPTADTPTKHSRYERRINRASSSSTW